ncbi:MAG TPA: glycoside hydrolase family 130 protein [bacterium]|nr:glycoside hydrolase family 130 protein [bacterium]
MNQIPVRRTEAKFVSDPSRVITKFYYPGSQRQARHVIRRVLSLPEERAKDILAQVCRDFSHRHRDIDKVFRSHFNHVEKYVPPQHTLPESRKLLIGSYFTNEYSIEAAGFFNPSIVPHPNQRKVREGEMRFILSFRATGEGHISSIEFRSGILDKYNHVIMDPVLRYAETPDIAMRPSYDKDYFDRKLKEMKLRNSISASILKQLPETFTFKQLQIILEAEKERRDASIPLRDIINTIYWIARSNHERKFRRGTHISERVLFPVSKEAVKGLEDARFVRFTDTDGSVRYYATYTAYNGIDIMSMITRTDDFETFHFNTLSGDSARDKGMALFPRKIDGKYVMISRIDGENLYLMSSDIVQVWNNAEILQTPVHHWELVQIGNCGSPIETPEGWLLITHGVGPMRQYSIGAILLDLNDPSKVIARLEEPLLVPHATEREGYVPNVVYSCGGMIHRGELVLPYAMSDSSCGLVTVPMDELLAALQPARQVEEVAQK